MLQPQGAQKCRLRENGMCECQTPQTGGRVSVWVSNLLLFQQVLVQSIRIIAWLNETAEVFGSLGFWSSSEA